MNQSGEVWRVLVALVLIAVMASPADAQRRSRRRAAGPLVHPRLPRSGPFTPARGPIADSYGLSWSGRVPCRQRIDRTKEERWRTR